MASENRGDQLKRLYDELKKKYKPIMPVERSVLEHFIFATCLEDAPYEVADSVYAAMVHTLSGWNEVRVSSPTELMEMMPKHPDGRQAAVRVKRILQYVFETTYAFSLDELRKMNLSLAVERLEKISGATPFSVAYTAQVALGRHGIPVGPGERQVLYVLGILSEKELEEKEISGLNRSIKKADGIEFASLLHQLAATFVRNPEARPLISFMKSFNPSYRMRLPSRRSVRSTQTDETLPPQPGMKRERNDIQIPLENLTLETDSQSPSEITQDELKTSRKASVDTVSVTEETSLDKGERVKKPLQEIKHSDDAVKGSQDQKGVPRVERSAKKENIPTKSSSSTQKAKVKKSSETSSPEKKTVEKIVKTGKRTPFSDKPPVPVSRLSGKKVSSDKSERKTGVKLKSLVKSGVKPTGKPTSKSHTRTGTGVKTSPLERQPSSGKGSVKKAVLKEKVTPKVTGKVKVKVTQLSQKTASAKKSVVSEKKVVPKKGTPAKSAVSLKKAIQKPSSKGSVGGKPAVKKVVSSSKSSQTGAGSSKKTFINKGSVKGVSGKSGASSNYKPGHKSARNSGRK